MNTPSVFAGRRVLLVEDEYLIADALRDALESDGAHVLGPAPSVEAAFELLDAEAGIDAAILDVNLGGEMVFPVADRLRMQGVPLVFLTGYDAWALPTRYADHARCEKPIDLRQLRAAFAQLH